MRETLAGKIVLSIGCDFKSDDALGLTVDDKKRLDVLHLRKIDIADEVLILNVNGYIGESTKKELEYAKGLFKRVRYLEPPKSELVESPDKKQQTQPEICEKCGNDMSVDKREDGCLSNYCPWCGTRKP